MGACGGEGTTRDPERLRLLGISTRDFLVDVLHKLEHGWPVRRVAELVPDRWASERGLLVTSN